MMFLGYVIPNIEFNEKRIDVICPHCGLATEGTTYPRAKDFESIGQLEYWEHVWDAHPEEIHFFSKAPTTPEEWAEAKAEALDNPYKN